MIPKITINNKNDICILCNKNKVKHYRCIHYCTECLHLLNKFNGCRICNRIAIGCDYESSDIFVNGRAYNILMDLDDTGGISMNGFISFFLLVIMPEVIFFFLGYLFMPEIGKAANKKIKHIVFLYRIIIPL